jgi:hypothetical protein
VSPVAPSPDTFFEVPESTVEGQVPRDQYDHPMIVPPPGVAPRFTSGKWAGYTPYARASGFGGQIEDDTNLVKWQKRQVARGVGLMYEQGVLRLGPQGGLPLDPREEPNEKWQKDRWNELAKAAENAVGSYAKADRGTAIHYATELIDKGDTANFAALPADLRERGDAYFRFCREWGIQPTSVEVFGVEDEHEVAGTWDRTGYCAGRHRILDVKTSSTMDFAGIGFAVQLAEYAHASRYNLSTHERYPHEDMDLETAFIIHVGREEGSHVELVKVDIATGWRYAQTVNAVIQARRDGRKAIKPINDAHAWIISAPTRAELEHRVAIYGELIENSREARELANAMWEVLR